MHARTHLYTDTGTHADRHTRPPIHTNTVLLLHTRTHTRTHTHTHAYSHYRQIYDGPDDSGTLLSKMCGGVQTPVTMAAGTEAFVRFVSDDSTQGTGFSGTFTVGNAGELGRTWIRVNRQTEEQAYRRTGVQRKTCTDGRTYSGTHVQMVTRTEDQTYRWTG